MACVSANTHPFSFLAFPSLQNFFRDRVNRTERDVNDRPRLRPMWSTSGTNRKVCFWIKQLAEHAGPFKREPGLTELRVVWNLTKSKWMFQVRCHSRPSLRRRKRGSNATRRWMAPNVFYLHIGLRRPEYRWFSKSSHACGRSASDRCSLQSHRATVWLSQVDFEATLREP